MIRIVSMAVSAAVLAACASAPDNAPQKSVAANQATSAVPTDGLPAQKLAPGECGLFLWGMAAPRKFVFFLKANTGDGLVLIDDKSHALRMVSARGEVFGQFLTEMGFSGSGTDTRVSVTLIPGETLEGGQRVKSGNLLFTGADGWETVLPVTGVRACMPGG